MSLVDRIRLDLTAAMKSRDAAKVAVLRMLKARLMEAEVEQRTAKGRDYQLEDELALRAISGYAKQRRDAIQSFVKGGRADLAERERGELAIVESYLPKQLEEEELRRLVVDTIREVGASTARDTGAVMKSLMPKIAGRADGKRASALVRSELA
jgi:uncharacterized protein YqeY